MPIYVDPELEAIEDFPLDGEAVGWVPGDRRIVLHSDALDAPDVQLRAVVAHEIGHHRGHHVFFSKVWKGIVMAVGIVLLLSMMYTAIYTQNLRLLVVLLPFYLAYPAFVMLSSGWISRRLELDADRRAARLIGLDAYRASLVPGPEVSPSGIHERFWLLCHPWPSAADRLAALDSES